MVVLVTGANGQLGQALQNVSQSVSEIRFVFTDSKTLNITDNENCLTVLEQDRPNFGINRAANTALAQAGSGSGLGHKANVAGVESRAESCKIHSAALMHLATVFVVAGEINTPYSEVDIPSPKNVYG